MAGIDFSKVNISLQKFQEISSGEYNAGEVRLAGQDSLAKINNRVHFTGLNKTSLTHAEVIAIKDAFVKALRDGGLGDAEINAIRAKLGLAPSGAVDTSLRERSLKPLSRQQIRDILDQYATVLNVRTSDELYANVSAATRQTREATRQNVNGELDGKRATEVNIAVARFQLVVAGDVDFFSGADRTALRNEAKRQLEALYAGCANNPSADKSAKVSCTLAGGQTVEVDTGMSEAAYADRLYAMIVRLDDEADSGWLGFRVRDEYQALDPQGRSAWIDGLANHPKPDFSARTVAVMLLQGKGVADYETLSLVNKMPLERVAGLLKTLESGEELTHDKISNIMRQGVVEQEVDADDAYIPATSPSQYNKGVRRFLTGKSDSAPPGFNPFADAAIADLRSRFGEGIVPADAILDPFIDSSALSHLVQVEGDGDFAKNVTRVRVDDIREPFTRMAHEQGARKTLAQFILTVGREIDAHVDNKSAIANGIFNSNPTLLGRLAECANPAEVAGILNGLRADVERSIRKNVAITYYRKQGGFEDLVRKALSDATGIPPSSFGKHSLSNSRMTALAVRLASKINDGEVAAETDEEIGEAYREEARKFAAERAALLAKVDELSISDAAKAELKIWFLSQDKVSYVNLDAITAGLQDVTARVGELATALKQQPQRKEAVYQAMHNLTTAVNALAHTQLDDLEGEVGVPEHRNLTTAITILGFDRFPGVRDDLADFLAQPDVKAEMDANYNCIAHEFSTYGAPKYDQANAALADNIAGGRPDAASGQAIVQACRDAGLTEITPDEAVQLFTSGKPLAAALREALVGLPILATPQVLRLTVAGVLKHHAEQIREGRPVPELQVPLAQRKEAVISKIAGGQGPAAQKARQVLEAKLGPAPADPEARTFGEIARNVKVLLLKGLLVDLKKIANGKEGMYTSKDLERSIVMLNGVGQASRTDATTARDQFAKFMTGKADATYARLSATDRKKADLAMAMAAQTSKNAVSMGTAIMMDPQGREVAFTPCAPAGMKKLSWSMSMELNENGDLKVSLVGTMEPGFVLFKDGAIEMCGPGSTFKYAADFTFKATELERISKLDFSEYDSTDLDNLIDKQKPEQTYEGAINRIQEKFRLDVGIHVELESNFT